MKAKTKAKLIDTLSNLLVSNKTIGRYEKLENKCISKLHELIDSIDINENKTITKNT